VDDLIKIPPTVPLEKACMLPCGALRAYSAIDMVKPFFLDKLKHNNGKYYIYIYYIRRELHAHVLYVGNENSRNATFYKVASDIYGVYCRSGECVNNWGQWPGSVDFGPVSPLAGREQQQSASLCC
jgi:hypothetical protein